MITGFFLGAFYFLAGLLACLYVDLRTGERMAQWVGLSTWHAVLALAAWPVACTVALLTHRPDSGPDEHTRGLDRW